MGKWFFATIIAEVAILPLAASAAEPVPVITPVPVHLPTEGSGTTTGPMAEIVPLENAEPLPESMPVITPVSVRLPEPLPVAVQTASSSSKDAVEQTVRNEAADALSGSSPSVEAVASAGESAQEGIASPPTSETSSESVPPLPPIKQTGSQPRLRKAIISEEPSVSAAPI